MILILIIDLLMDFLCLGVLTLLVRRLLCTLLGGAGGHTTVCPLPSPGGDTSLRFRVGRPWACGRAHSLGGMVGFNSPGVWDPVVDSWHLADPCIDSTRDPVSEVVNMAPGRVGCVESGPLAAVCKTASLVPSPFLLVGSGDGVLDLSVGSLSASPTTIFWTCGLVLGVCSSLRLGGTSEFVSIQAPLGAMGGRGLNSIQSL